MAILLICAALQTGLQSFLLPESVRNLSAISMVLHYGLAYLLIADTFKMPKTDNLDDLDALMRTAKMILISLCLVLATIFILIGIICLALPIAQNGFMPFERIWQVYAWLFTGAGFTLWVGSYIIRTW